MHQYNSLCTYVANNSSLSQFLQQYLHDRLRIDNCIAIDCLMAWLRARIKMNCVRVDCMRVSRHTEYFTRWVGACHASSMTCCCFLDAVFDTFIYNLAFRLQYIHCHHHARRLSHAVIGLTMSKCSKLIQRTFPLISTKGYDKT
jgi:hypothetical protein